MASSTLFRISIALSILTLALNIASTTSEEQNAFILPIKKDGFTLQYVTTIQIGIGSSPITLSVDIGGWVTWFNHDNGYNASSYQYISCNDFDCGPDPTDGLMLFCGTCSPQSKILPPCNPKTIACAINDINPYIMELASYARPGAGLSAVVAKDVLVISSTNVSGRGKRRGVPINIPDFAFSYVNSGFLQRLSSQSKGVLGLGKSPLSLHSQIISTFNIADQFSICLPSQSRSTGVLYIGVYNGSASHRHLLMTTPLVGKAVNDNSWPANIPPTEYYIGVTSINIDGEIVPFDSSLLSFLNEDTIGGTRLSTAIPYAAFHSDIYQPLLKIFKKRATAMKIKEVGSMGGFGACFDAKTIKKSANGEYFVPAINLVLQDNSVYWRIQGHNSMKRMNDEVMCLAIVDAGTFYNKVQYGESLVTAVIIGGYQLENNFLEFDLASSELRFSSSLVAQGLSCSHLRGNYL